MSMFRFGDEGCLLLCANLADNRSITRLSLTYCDLGPVCGNRIGRLLVQTAITYLLNSYLSDC
jgi:Ran GTPase-activating protein (RanGAP) involved in mRNA processing and transport